MIELLIVIAIIAVLAAVLFPVFAQAKAAAKKTTCISNLKQLSLGTMMYINDHDDTFMLRYGSASSGAPTWALVLQPYVKNRQIAGSTEMLSEAQRNSFIGTFGWVGYGMSTILWINVGTPQTVHTNLPEPSGVCRH